MATDFKYASQSDMQRYVGDIVADADGKRQIYGFQATDTTNQYQANNTGFIDQLFFDGIEGTSVGDNPDANYEYNWSSATDSVQVFISTADPNDMIIEAGFDNATYYDQMLVDASMELNNLLDARYPTPLPKVAQIDQNTASISQSKEYDAIVIKMTCYICVANILRSEFKMEEADYYHGLVTNGERTGMADRLNAGEFKLSYEVDAKDRQGAINNKSVAGSMDIVETAGEYYGQKFDLLKIEATVTGAYGVGKVKVHYYGNDKIWGQESSEEFVTGGLQSLAGLGGLLVRFQGSSITDGDTWEIEVSSADRKLSNPMTGGIELTRGTRGY